MELDFTFLRNSSDNAASDFQNEPQEAESKTNTSIPLNAPERSERAEGQQEQANGLVIRQQYENHRTEEANRIAKAYQENIRKSGSLQSEILKGAQAGEDCYSLLLKACKCISCMTSDTVFYNTMDSVVRNVYGYGLLERQPLEMELTQLRERLSTLKASYQRESASDTRERIADSIKRHEQRAEELERLISRQSNA